MKIYLRKISLKLYSSYPAAHKHVPLMEHSPEEAIKNNVIGTLNVAECASEYGDDRFCNDFKNA